MPTTRRAPGAAPRRQKAFRCIPGSRTDSPLSGAVSLTARLFKLLSGAGPAASQDDFEAPLVSSKLWYWTTRLADEALIGRHGWSAEARAWISNRALEARYRAVEPGFALAPLELRPGPPPAQRGPRHLLAPHCPPAPRRRCRALVRRGLKGEAGRRPQGPPGASLETRKEYERSASPFGWPRSPCRLRIFLSPKSEGNSHVRFRSAYRHPQDRHHRLAAHARGGATSPPGPWDRLPPPPPERARASHAGRPVD